MPAKKKITKELILNAALDIARERGLAAVNTTTLTKRLNCSTQPVYLSFDNMDDLKSATIAEMESAYQRCLADELAAGKYPVYKAYGMGYIKFAAREKQFFKQLFMTGKAGDDSSLGEIYRVIMQLTGLPLEEAKLFHLESWIFVHGIASMLATDYLTFTEDFIAGLVTDMFEGLKVRFGVAVGESRQSAEGQSGDKEKSGGQACAERESAPHQNGADGGK